MPTENKKLIGILPLGGNASRMLNLPKFLLPCDIGKTLLDHTIEKYNANGIYDIRAGISEDNFHLLKNVKTLNKKVVSTKTMAETVKQITNELSALQYKSVLIMPDTYFVLKDELKNMINMLDYYNIVVILWKISDYQKGKVGQCCVSHGEITDIVDKNKNCDYEYLWGCIGWNSILSEYINPKWETIGDLIKYALNNNIKVGAIINDGYYYDCGTIEEYFNMIKSKNYE